MSYLQMATPNRSEHQWRYTPWEKIHPTNVNLMPSLPNANVELNGSAHEVNSAREFDEGF